MRSNTIADGCSTYAEEPRRADLARYIAPGDSRRGIGDVFIAFTSVSCTFLAEVHAGDTLYPQLQITGLAPRGDAGQVTTRATIRNQHGQLVLDGEHTYLLKTAQHSTPGATS
jgi:acyl dehydratase